MYINAEQLFPEGAIAPEAAYILLCWNLEYLVSRVVIHSAPEALSRVV